MSWRHQHKRSTMTIMKRHRLLTSLQPFTAFYYLAAASVHFCSLASSSASSWNASSAFIAGIGESIIVPLPHASRKAYTTSSMTSSGSTTGSNNNNARIIDVDYPGTAVERMRNVRARVAELNEQKDDDENGNNVLNGPWDKVRRKLLWAGGLRDLPNSQPGQGYTGHSFNDFNHVDLTCMVDNVSDNQNDGSVKGIAVGNQLGNGIRIASLPELGPGGSWSTCAMGCNKEPPQDVAHVQFRARIAFKLVWVPNDNFDTFVLVDDDGNLLAKGTPNITSDLPPLRERQTNYRLVQGSKYSREADKLARNDVLIE